MNASGNGKMKTHDSSRQWQQGAWPTGAFDGGGGGLDLKLYLDLGLGGSEIKCKKVCKIFCFFFCNFPTFFPLS